MRQPLLTGGFRRREPVVQSAVGGDEERMRFVAGVVHITSDPYESRLPRINTTVKC
jgi:hypothetical protein